jgi:two-component system chemotaxis sensor kinase CheA
LLNEAGELMTCTIRARQHARDINTLAELPARWRRIWRQAHPTMTRLKSRAPALRPTVHHLLDRDEIQSFDAATVADQDTAVLLDVLAQANTLIAELESQLTKESRQSSEDYARLAAVTDRMHSQVRRTRMLPLTTLLNPLRLQLRDMARAAGKQIVLELDDGGAEADRQVLERLREVLLHLLRNAVDHGIEPAAARVAAGKPVTGCITLRAAVSGDHLTLTLADDGAGLDLEAIRQRALMGGLLSEADATRVSDADVADLIFVPGFSTRKTVNELSGRGVGLDIVRSNVERMNGRVFVQSVPGAGTSFTLNVPLSLTSSHGLLLQVNNANYVLPLDSVQRIIQTTPASVQMIEGRVALIVDQRPLTLVRLADLLGVDERAATGNGSRPVQGLALILGSGERQVACLVDTILGEQELVVHRLPAPLQRVRFIAGATILADGKVVPILDVVDIVRATIGTHRSISLMPAPVTVQRTATILVVDDSITTRTLEKNILEAAGYRVYLATDGVEALNTLQRLSDDGGCDLLLSDIDMPRLNGFDLTVRVRADLHFQHLPVVLVTSLDTPTDRERGISSGADAYIVKRTFDQQTLLDTIAQLI